MTKEEKEREAFIVNAVNRAVDEMSAIRRAGTPICDIAFIEGAMIEAARDYDQRLHTQN